MSDSLSVNARPSGYHDFGGLASLRGEAAQGADAALHETAKQFETYFIQQTMKAMRDTVERSDLTDNADGDMFQDLMDKEVAAKMAERGSLGLAQMIVDTMSQRMAPPPSTQDVLAARAMPLVPPAQAVPLAVEAATPRVLPRTGGPMSLESGLYGRSPSPSPGPAQPAATTPGGEP